MALLNTYQLIHHMISLLSLFPTVPLRVLPGAGRATAPLAALPSARTPVAITCSHRSNSATPCPNPTHHDLPIELCAKLS